MTIIIVFDIEFNERINERTIVVFSNSILFLWIPERRRPTAAKKNSIPKMWWSCLVDVCLPDNFQLHSFSCLVGCSCIRNKNNRITIFVFFSLKKRECFIITNISYRSSEYYQTLEWQTFCCNSNNEKFNFSFDCFNTNRHNNSENEVMTKILLMINFHESREMTWFILFLFF